MAKLTTSKRNHLPKSSFGLPGEKKYPMPDKSHARNAKARASQQYNRGNLSLSSKEKIDAMANRKLGKHHESKKGESRHEHGMKSEHKHEHEKRHEEHGKKHHSEQRRHHEKQDHPHAHEHIAAAQHAMRKAHGHHKY